MTKDLTHGSPMRVILLFTFPLVLGNLFQQFYSLADTIIVGRFCGVSALASVGSTGSVNYLILGFVIGICNGFAIPIAQLFGAKDFFGSAPPRCQRRMAVHRAVGGAYRAYGGAYPPDAGADADPG